MNPSRPLAFLLLGLAAAAWAAPASGEAFLQRNAAWSSNATGTDLGTAWRAPGYDDSAWPQGPGVLGYGESYIATWVSYGPDSGNKYPTTYFRVPFAVAGDPGALTHLLAEVNYDDGFVLYLNGSEVARRGLGTGTVSYSTLASSHESGVYEQIDLTSFTGLLVSGANVLAAEVHQTSPTSSDLAWDASLTGSTLPAVITRGPYLQTATPERITVRWRTDAAVGSRVRYGASVGALTATAVDSSAVTEHVMTLTGLAPDTRYVYAVGTPGVDLAGDDTTFVFTTPPPVGTRRKTRLWVIGDSGTGDSYATSVRDGYLAWSGGVYPDAWLMLGDNAYSTGTDAEYQLAVFDTYPRFLRRVPLWPTRGNHDRLYAGANNDYYDIMTLPTDGVAGGVASGTEAYYTFDLGDIHFICLDSEGSDLSPGGAMLTWLAADVAATDREWVIAFWHHPPYTKGSHDSDDDYDSAGKMKLMRTRVLPILEDAGVDLVLAGHSHSYERSMLLDSHYGYSWELADSNKVDPGDGRMDGNGAYVKPTAGQAPHEGAVYVVAGSGARTGGGPLNHPVMIASLNELGSLVLDVDGDRLDATFVGPTGADQDHFSLVKGPVTAVPEGPAAAGLRLAPPSPNPFRGPVRMDYTLPRRGPVRLAVLDVRGRTVAVLEEGVREAGPHTVRWDGRDGNGRPVSPGVYFGVLRAGPETRTRKLVLTR